MSVAHSGEVTSTHLAPPTGLLPRKVEKSCTALAKSSKGAALPCPQEKQRGSCTALSEKQRDAVLRPKNSIRDTSPAMKSATDLHKCGFVRHLLVFLLSFFCLQRWYPARPTTNFRWRVQIIPPGLHKASGGGGCLWPLTCFVHMMPKPRIRRSQKITRLCLVGGRRWLKGLSHVGWVSPAADTALSTEGSYHRGDACPCDS